MGRLGDLFAPSDVGYPGLPGTVAAGNNGGNYSPPANTGFFNQFFAPTDLPYPLPAYVNTLGQPGFVAGGPTMSPTPVTQPAPTVAPSSTPVATPTAPAPTVPTTSAPAPSTPAAPASASPTPSASPVTVIVQTACPAAASAPAASDGGSTTTSTSKPASTSGTGGISSDLPVGNCPVPPTEQIVTAFATNPRLRARRARAEEVIADEMLDGKVALRMLSKDSAPVAFVVPDGCDAVDFTFGAIEANPGTGNPQDLDEVVTIGAPVVNGTDGGSLAAGDQITVVIPWRYGSWVELAADHLRLPIFARFYQIETA